MISDYPMIWKTCATPRHEAARDRLYYVLGMAITRWQHIDSALFLITHFAMQLSFDQSSRKFFDKRTAGRKLKLVDEVLKTRLHKDAYKDVWLKLKGEVKAVIKFRNGLAHFEVSFLPTLDSYADKTKYPVLISPHHNEMGAIKNGFVECLFIEEIETNAVEMVDMTYRLIYFLLDFLPTAAPQMPGANEAFVDGFRFGLRDPKYARPA